MIHKVGVWFRKFGVFVTVLLFTAGTSALAAHSIALNEKQTEKIADQNRKMAVLQAVQSLSEPATAEPGQQPSRAGRRLLLVGDSSMSLWDDELATLDRWAGWDIESVHLLAQEGKLPCYYTEVAPLAIEPGDLVLLSFSASGWHRPDSSTCNADLAPEQWQEWALQLVGQIRNRGGQVVALALPGKGETSGAFTGEPWWPKLDPGEIDAWWEAEAQVPVIGSECRTAEELGPDGFHTAPGAEADLGACIIQIAPLG